MLAPGIIARLGPIKLVNQTIRPLTYDQLDNKRITRLESDIELDDCEFKGRLINRNPRNLEQMSYDIKPQGFWLENNPPREWNKVVFEQSAGHLNAYLRHWSGKKIVEATTQEPRLSKYFKGTCTVQAATILGQILARRCLQSGYVYANADTHCDDETGVKTKAFFKALQTEGFALKEPPAIVPRIVTDL